MAGSQHSGEVFTCKGFCLLFDQVDLFVIVDIFVERNRNNLSKRILLVRDFIHINRIKVRFLGVVQNQKLSAQFGSILRSLVEILQPDFYGFCLAFYNNKCVIIARLIFFGFIYNDISACRTHTPRFHIRTVLFGHYIKRITKIVYQVYHKRLPDKFFRGLVQPFAAYM